MWGNGNRREGTVFSLVNRGRRVNILHLAKGVGREHGMVMLVIVRASGSIDVKVFLTRV